MEALQTFNHEIVNFNIGQAGVQISNATWELFCIEHGIMANGILKDFMMDDRCNYKTFFHETSSGQFVPRNLIVDLEPNCIDEIRTGPYRALHHPDNLINLKEDAANNFARGHFTLGKNLIDKTMEIARKTIELCDNIQGFVVTHSYGGGTGSGFTSLVMDRLSTDYGKRIKFDISIFPSPTMSTACVEPYNSVLSVHSDIDFADIAIIMDNEALYDISLKYLNVTSPTYNIINRLAANVFSAITVSLRYESSLNADMDSMCTNLVPYPRIHFPVINHAPIVSKGKALHQDFSIAELTQELFESYNQMVKCSPSDGKYMACCLQYRGDVTPRIVNKALMHIKKSLPFVDWCPTGFKVGINSQAPSVVPISEMAPSVRSVTMLANTTSISEAFCKLKKKFNFLFSKRSFVHHYVGEGMEEGEFSEAQDTMNQLIKDYMELYATPEEDGEYIASRSEAASPGTPIPGTPGTPATPKSKSKSKSNTLNKVADVKSGTPTQGTVTPASPVSDYEHEPIKNEQIEDRENIEKEEVEVRQEVEEGEEVGEVQEIEEGEDYEIY